MAKQFSITGSVNGGASVQHDVVIKDTESPFTAEFYFRTWKAFSMADADVLNISAWSGPTSVGNPMSWDTVPSGLIAVVSVGHGISLAFIN